MQDAVSHFRSLGFYKSSVRASSDSPAEHAADPSDNLLQGHRPASFRQEMQLIERGENIAQRARDARRLAHYNYDYNYIYTAC